MSDEASVKIGDAVRIRFGRHIATGTVIEFRGTLGVDGTSMYRIRYTLDPEFVNEIEMPVDRFEVVRDEATAG